MAKKFGKKAARVGGNNEKEKKMDIQATIGDAMVGAAIEDIVRETEVREPEQKTTEELLAELEELKKEAAALAATTQAPVAVPVVKPTSGKGRPLYHLLQAPITFHKTKQVSALQRILFGQPKRDMPEEEIFGVVRAGAAAGLLQTKQDPARIFSYYRNHLMAAGNIKWD
jgi:hypothetical protein